MTMRLPPLVACAGFLLATARFAGAQLPDATVPAGLGVNVHFVGRPEARDIAMIKAAGFRFVRTEILWANVEREKGNYNFRGYRECLDDLADNGIRPLVILAYGNQLYDPDPELYTVATDEARRAFAEFAAATVAQFKGRGVIWELWNEPNAPHFWKPKPDADAYMALAKTALPAMRQADPQATIIGPAASNVDTKFLEKCFQQGLLEMVDGISVHPYRDRPPETVTADYEQLRLLIARYAPKGKEALPIVSGEWGYSSMGMPEEQQGQYLARQFLANLMNGVALSIWYDWHDDGQDPKDDLHHFGTVTWDYQAKPSYIAAQNLIRELAGYRYIKRLALPSSDDFALVFTNGKQQKLALWTVREPHRIALDLTPPLEIDLTARPRYLAMVER